MRQKTAYIILIYLCLLVCQIQGQTIAPNGIRLARISFLTSNLDSLTRSFAKKGYTIKPGKREPGGILTNSIILPNECEMILETTLTTDSIDWRLQSLKKYGNHVSGIAFEVDKIDTLYNLFQSHQIPTDSLRTILKEKKDGSEYLTHSFALDSCAPLDVIFFSKGTLIAQFETVDSLTKHPNHVFRFDWVLLTASPAIEARMRKIFAIVNAWKQHENYGDFWRVGPSDNFCFFRFDSLSPKGKEKNDWLSVETDGIYFAY
jgi:hypothetical protein